MTTSSLDFDGDDTGGGSWETGAGGGRSCICDGPAEAWRCAHRGIAGAGRGGAGGSGAGRGISVMAWCIAGDGDLSPNSKPTGDVSHHHVANELIDLRGWIR